MVDGILGVKMKTDRDPFFIPIVERLDARHQRQIAATSKSISMLALL